MPLFQLLQTFAHVETEEMKIYLKTQSSIIVDFLRYFFEGDFFVIVPEESVSFKMVARNISMEDVQKKQQRNNSNNNNKAKDKRGRW